MGKAARIKPKRLAEKLLQIRSYLRLSQNEMLRKIGFEDKLLRTDISYFERGVREPSLLVLLEYARAVGVSTDDLIDDSVDILN